jgi:hypothetical protein
LGFKTSRQSDSYCWNGKRARIQSLIKAVELDLEKKIGLPSGQKAWVKMYLKLSTNCISKKKITKSIKMISTQNKS